LRGPTDVFKNSPFDWRQTRVAATDPTLISELLSRQESDIIADWLRLQVSDGRRMPLVDENELRQQAREFLSLVRTAAQSGRTDDIAGRDWDDTRRMLEDLSRSRARLGFSPTQTATFVFSLKEPLFARLRTMFAKDPDALASSTWMVNTLLDKLGLYTTEVYQKGRECTRKDARSSSTGSSRK
jgi:rsbT co-antagonist protein RsbR